MFCNQARWAKDGQIADVFDRMSALLYDSQSVVVRQCVTMNLREMCWLKKRKTMDRRKQKKIKKKRQFPEMEIAGLQFSIWF